MSSKSNPYDGELSKPGAIEVPKKNKKPDQIWVIPNWWPESEEGKSVPDPPKDRLPSKPSKGGKPPKSRKKK